MSANHGNNFLRAKKIIKLAKESGANAIKLQCYTSDCMTINSKKKDFIVKGNNPWKGKNLYDLYNSASTPFAWFKDLLKYSKFMGFSRLSETYY